MSLAEDKFNRQIASLLEELNALKRMRAALEQKVVSLTKELDLTKSNYIEKIDEAKNLQKQLTEAKMSRFSFVRPKIYPDTFFRNELETLLSSLSESSLPGTQLNTVPHGMSHTNRGGVREWRTNHDGDEHHDLPEPEHDIRHYDDPDDDAVDPDTANLTGIDLENMRPSLISAIRWLAAYNYNMFPDLAQLVLRDSALARSTASLRREKYQLALAAVSAHDYNAARRHLRYIVQYLPYDYNTARRTNVPYMHRPAAHRTH